ncbi:MAG: ATP-dependent helicase [Desulfovibrio sp.]|jgi:DNA helicase-2/ATP-dependent DNA helicase PcrA|nr:ATP-dependent helicase [Desulfovibrio sp.]
MIDYAAALNEAQYEAVTCGDGPVLVVACAGSGKTRTIVYRLAWLAEHGIAPQSILLLTFTRKAAQEMLRRAATLLNQGLSGAQGGTFHSFAYGALRTSPPTWLNGRIFTLMDSQNINDAVKHCKDTLKLGRNDRSFPKTQTIAGLLSKARNKELPLAEILEREAFHLLPHLNSLEQLETAYITWRREKCLLDYDDLLFELETLLNNPETAASLRRRFTHILVDEYQDTNRVQARIVRLLGGADVVDAPDCNVMAVGDEAQSIYAFRGATVRNILDFPNFFPGTRVIRLEENYRSTKPVLDVANSLLAYAAESFRKKLFTRLEDGEAVRLVVPLSDMSEAALVVRRIRELLNICLPHEIAVLFRAGFHSYHLEMALQHAGIPFRKYGGLRYSEAAHVKDVIAYARLVINPLDMPAFARVAALHSGIGPKTAQKLHLALTTLDEQAMSRSFARFPDLLDDMHFITHLQTMPQNPADILAAVLERYFPKMETLYPDDWPRRRQGLEEIIHMASGYAALDMFVADLALESPEEDENDGENRIVLSTIHSAKGLEWRAVLILDLVEDRFPSRHALAREDDFEEERRLMYVACTRARRHLDLYAPSSIYSRAERGTLYVNRSPFLRELAPELVETWVEGYGGRLSRRAATEQAVGGVPFSDGAARPACADLNSAAGFSAEPAGHFQIRDDKSAENAASRNRDRASAGMRCRHRIFGTGKVIKELPPDKMQVYFPGFGLKVILSEYLNFE